MGEPIVLQNVDDRAHAQGHGDFVRGGARSRPRLANTEAFRRSRRERKKVEMLFAHMKRILKLDRLRLRGLSGPGRGSARRRRPELEKARRVCRTTTPDGTNLLCCLGLARVESQYVPPIHGGAASKAPRPDIPQSEPTRAVGECCNTIEGQSGHPWSSREYPLLTQRGHA